MTLEPSVMGAAAWKRLLSGPLLDHIKGFYRWLEEHQFSQRAVERYLAHLSYLQERLSGRPNEDFDTVRSEDLDGFLAVCPSGGVRGSIRRFVLYLQEKGQYRPARSQVLYEPLLDAYVQWLRDYWHAAERTIDARIEYARLFFDWLGPQATPEGMSALTVGQIQDFCLSFAERRPGSVHAMGVMLRNFFRFCLHKGYLQEPLDGAVPSVRSYRLATVPCGYTDEQVQKLLEGIDRQSPAGCRDYAMCMLLYTYGVRSGQLRALRLQDIYWEENQIFFKGNKRGKDSLLPLTAQVGEILLNYLQNTRPRGTGYAEVFLTAFAPYHPLSRENLSSQIRKLAFAAGVYVRNRGPHAFRHAFATRMVREGHSLKEIADVLGHRNLEATFIYTKVDFNALSKVALPWPQEGCQ